MHVILIIVGLLKIALGIAVLGGARSAIQETVGAIAVSSGILTIAICLAVLHLIAIRENSAKILDELKGLGRRIDAREAGDVDRHATLERMAAVFDRLGKRA